MTSLKAGVSEELDAGTCQDFREMIVHHVVTTALMVMSWTANMVRVGTLVLCVHDAVDYLLEVRVEYR